MTTTEQFSKQLRESVHTISTKHIFFTGKLMSIPHHEDDSINTAHTDGNSITYNPQFFDNLRAKQRVTLVAHELAHIIFAHFLRMRGRDGELWNVATDHAINLLLSAMGFEPLDNWLCDRKYLGWSAEDIYSDLNKKDQKDQDQQKQQSKDSGGQFEEPKNSDGSPMTPEQMEEAMEGAIKDAKRAKNAVDRAIKGVQKSESLNTDEKKKLTNEIGRGFKEIISELNDLSNSRIDWQDVMNRFLHSLSLDDFNYNEPETDLMETTGFYFPVMQTQEFGNVGLALDVSGSLHAESKQVASEALHTLGNISKKELRLFYVSDVLHKTILATSEDDVEHVKGGGTDFTPLFNHFNEQEYNFKGLIFLTDGWVNDMDKWIEPDFPVLWILTRKNEFFENNVPFGDVVHFN